MPTPKMLLLLFLILSMTAANGDIIRGTVTDAADNAPLPGVKVSLDATHYSFTGADGKYELNTEVVTGLQSGRTPPGLRWDAGAGRFRWDRTYGEVTVEVSDARGSLVDRRVLGPDQAAQGYAPGKGSGIRFVVLKSRSGAFRFRIHEVGGAPMMAREEAARAFPDKSGRAASPGLAKASAAPNLTFQKPTYENATRSVPGSQDGVNVALQPNAVATWNNGLVEISYTRSSGAITAKNLAANLVFIKSATLSQSGGTARYLDGVTENNLAGGQALEITHADGNKDRILLFPGSQFVYFKKWIGNNGTADRTVKLIDQVKTVLGNKVAATSLRVAGTEAKITDLNQKSYHFLAMADAATRNGVVGAWVTGSVASGIVEGGLAGNDATLTAISEFGTLNVKPGQSKECDMYAVGWFDDALDGLTYNADDIARVYKIAMKPNQVVFCTWYSVGQAGTPANLTYTSNWLKDNLVKYGYGVVQLDAGWQVGNRRFDGYNPRAFPQGMKPLADKFKADGMMGGLWYMPFVGTVDDPYFFPWHLKDAAGNPETTGWANTSLDVTLPPVKDYIRRVTKMIYTDWGYQYFKIDGMFTGLGAHQNYRNDAYKPDDFFFNSRPSDKYKTNVEAYRDAWDIIRAEGPQAFIMGCTIAQNMRTLQSSFGLMDAIRIGPDGGWTWETIVTKGLLRAGRRYFYNGRVFWVDPDPVYPEPSFGRMMCTYNAFVGYMLTVMHTKESGDFEKMTPAMVETMKRTMPHHGAINVKPVDFFERDNPGVWLLKDERSGVRRDLVGLFNWDQANAFNPNYSMAKLGLDGSKQYIGFDFWDNRFIAPFSGNLNQVVPPAGGRVISVRPISGLPMVLSTNRHVADPVYSVEKEAWNGSMLSGTSKVVGGDAYELRIYAAKGAGGNWTAGVVTVSGGATISVAQTGPEVRVTIKSATNQTVNWTAAFN